MGVTTSDNANLWQTVIYVCLSELTCFESLSLELASIITTECITRGAGPGY